MSDFTHDNLWNDNFRGHKGNYLGVYRPMKFWEEYGNAYLETFFPIKQYVDKQLEININVLVSRLAILKSKQVLEVGSGFGRCLGFLAERLGTLEQVTGIEASESMIHRMGKYFGEIHPIDEAAKKKIKVVHGRAQKLPFPDHSFDAVYTHVCLTHIPPEDIEQVIDEIDRVSRNWIIHIERFAFAYEHSQAHRWSHLLVPSYLKRGWIVHEHDQAHKGHFTNLLVLKRRQEVK